MFHNYAVNLHRRDELIPLLCAWYIWNLNKGFHWLTHVSVPFLISQHRKHLLTQLIVCPTPLLFNCHHDYGGPFPPWLSAHPSWTAARDIWQSFVNVLYVDKLYYYPPSFLIWQPDTFVTLVQLRSDLWDFRSVYFSCFFLSGENSWSPVIWRDK